MIHVNLPTKGFYCTEPFKAYSINTLSKIKEVIKMEHNVKAGPSIGVPSTGKICICMGDKMSM